MKPKEEFKNWLPENDVESVASYMSYINQAKGATGESLDKFFAEAIEAAIEERVTLDKFAEGKNAKDVGDSKSAIRKYWDFIQHKAGIEIDN